MSNAWEGLLFSQPKGVICVLLQLGVMTYGDVTKQSPETQAAIEQEVRALLKVSFSTALGLKFTDIFIHKLISFNHFLSSSIQDSYERAKNILKTYSKEHKKLADALLTHETLDAKEIQRVLEGK